MESPMESPMDQQGRAQAGRERNGCLGQELVSQVGVFREDVGGQLEVAVLAVQQKLKTGTRRGGEGEGWGRCSH